MQEKGAGREPVGAGVVRSTESEGRALVEAWEASGLAVAEFCRQRDIPAHRVHYWKRRLPEADRTVENQVESREFFAVDVARDEHAGVGPGGLEESISLWVGSSVRVEIPRGASRDTFVRMLRWTLEAAES